MLWWLLFGAAAIYLEERPDKVAHLGLRLQAKGYRAALVAKYIYILSRYLHTQVHSTLPQKDFDKLALVTWINGSQLIDKSLRQIREETAIQPSFDQRADLLLEAYHSVFPDKPSTGRKAGKEGIDWVALGFQGADPCDDFRASGLLGLRQFCAFCIKTPKDALRLAQESRSVAPSSDPKWYSLALASIYITNALCKLLLEEPLFVACIAGKTMAFDHLFTSVHSGLLMAFHEHWLSECRSGMVQTVMETDQSLKRFEKRIPDILWRMRASLI